MNLVDMDAMIRKLSDMDPDEHLLPADVTFEMASDAFDKMPIADVVPVVRCKDCKFRDEDAFCTGRGYPYQLVPDDGFCDKGKKEREHERLNQQTGGY